MPFDIGVDAGWSRPPMASALGTTENITVSWWPWYEPSIFRTLSRPVAARAMRMASIVASVPELAKRTGVEVEAAAQLLGERDRDRGRGGEVRAGARRLLDRLDDLGVRVPDDVDAEAAVEVEVLGAVDVPHV